MRRLQLTRLSLTRSQDQGSFVGDRCPVCEADGRVGVIGVYAVKRQAGMVVRYLECRACGWKPNGNKMVSPDPDYKPRDNGQRRLPFDDPD